MTEPARRRLLWRLASWLLRVVTAIGVAAAVVLYAPVAADNHSYLGDIIGGLIDACVLFAGGTMAAGLVGNIPTNIALAIGAGLVLLAGFYGGEDVSLSINPGTWVLCVPAAALGGRFGQRLRGLALPSKRKALALTLVIAVLVANAPRLIAAWQLRRVESTHLPRLVAELSRELWPMQEGHLWLAADGLLRGRWQGDRESHDSTSVARIYLETWPRPGRIRDAALTLRWADYSELPELRTRVTALEDIRRLARAAGVSGHILDADWQRSAPKGWDCYYLWTKVGGAPAELIVDAVSIEAQIPPLTAPHAQSLSEHRAAYEDWAGQSLLGQLHSAWADRPPSAMRTIMAWMTAVLVHLALLTLTLPVLAWVLARKGEPANSVRASLSQALVIPGCLAVGGWCRVVAIMVLVAFAGWMALLVQDDFVSLH